jgi:hypothetical protein
MDHVNERKNEAIDDDNQPNKVDIPFYHANFDINMLFYYCLLSFFHRFSSFENRCSLSKIEKNIDDDRRNERLPDRISERRFVF